MSLIEAIREARAQAAKSTYDHVVVRDCDGYWVAICRDLRELTWVVKVRPDGRLFRT